LQGGEQLLERGYPVIAYWSFIACYVNDEGVRDMVKQSWKWEGDVGEQVYKCVSDYITEMYNTLTKSPFDEKSNAFTILSAMYAIMRKNLGFFDLRAMILGGTLKPVAVPLSRNACRERDRDRRQSESLRKEKEMAKIAEEASRRLLPRFQILLSKRRRWSMQGRWAEKSTTKRERHMDD
jgi:hypothetical protein